MNHNTHQSNTKPIPLRSSRNRRLGGAVAGAAIAGLVLSATGCSNLTVSMEDAKPDIGANTTNKEVDCAFEGADALVNTPTCYEISVPEDWSEPDKADQVVLAAAVFHATGTSPTKDPVIYLAGGPGGAGLAGIDEGWLVNPYIEGRDVIVFDQRGTGQSTPSLACTEVTEHSYASLKGEIPDDKVVDTGKTAVTKCHDRLVAAGVNLSEYNSVASSNDVEAIRTTLGYDKLNLLGVSYGTRLAQTYVRLYSDSTRSVILDSVEPVATNLHEESNQSFSGAIEMVFEECAADADCAKQYPTFEDDFFALVTDLEKQPVEIELYDPEGEPFKAEVSGVDLVSAVHASLYNKSSLAAIPEMVAQTRDGDDQMLTGFVQSAADFGDSISTGMHFSVECNEEVPFESAEQIEQDKPSDPRFDVLDDETGDLGIVDICQIWSVSKASKVENQPVDIDVPTLLLTGSFDPITPPKYAEAVAEHIKKYSLFEFPTEGHAVVTSECGSAIAASFVNNPDQAPEESCFEETQPPKWVVGTDDVELIPFDVDGLGTNGDVSFSGMVPDRWVSDGQGSFFRQDNAFDSTELYIDILEGQTSDEVLADFSIEFAPAEPTDVDGEQWETFIGEWSGHPVSLMFSPRLDALVLLGGSADEFDKLTETVAIPVAASLKVS